MSGILSPSSGAAMNSASADWTGISTLSPRSHLSVGMQETMSPPLSNEVNRKAAGDKAWDKALCEDSPLKHVQASSKRKEREGEVLDLTAISSSPIPSPIAPSSKRPKTTMTPSSNTKDHLITGTFVKLDLQRRTLTLNQEPQPLDKYTSYLSLMARFQEWLMEQPLEKEITQIPKEYWPLVVMIAHENSSIGKAKLAEHVGSALKPTEVGDGDVAKISYSTLTSLCTELLTQISYGFHPSDFSSLTASSSTDTTTTAAKDVKVAAALALKRWEAKDLELIPQSAAASAGRGFKARDVMKERKRFREQARDEVRKIAQGLDVDAVRQLLGLDKVDSEKAKVPAAIEAMGGKGQVKAENGDANLMNGTPATILQAKPGKAKPELTPEQLAEKEAKEAEKKAREAERLRKVEAKNKKAQEVAKSKAMMQGFFKKAKTPATTTASPASSSQATSVNVERRSESAEIEVISSNFQTSFKPFYAKASVEVAPVNRFALRQDAQVNCNTSSEVSQWKAKDLLADFMKQASTKTSHPVGRPKMSRKRSIVEESRSGLIRKPKTETLFCTIPDLVDRAQEAEDPRLVYSHLRDFTKFPRKTFRFEEDLRPPYSGTWTKPSWFVGPRTPFALDPNVDYSVDEGLDWEPENLDEGAMDVEEEEEPESTDDEDMGSWLASDDELEEEIRKPLDDPFMANDPLGMPAVKPKVGKESKLPPRRFEKLVQFSKGPVWENGLGEVAWKGFEPYRICVLNDTPLGGIDPFTWQIPEKEKPKAAAPVDKPVSTAGTPKQAAPTAPSVPSVVETTPKILAPRPVPKANLTQAELSDFLRAIEGSDKTMRALVIDLSGRFRSAGTQASVKAKLNEVATKAATKGAVWVVKPEAWSEAGVAPQPSKA